VRKRPSFAIPALALVLMGGAACSDPRTPADLYSKSNPPTRPVNLGGDFRGPRVCGEPCGICDVGIYDVSDTSNWGPTDTTICFEVTGLSPATPYGLLLEDASGQIVDDQQQEDFTVVGVSGATNCFLGLSPSTTYTVQFVPGGVPAGVGPYPQFYAGSACDPASAWVTWQQTTAAAPPTPQQPANMPSPRSGDTHSLPHGARPRGPRRA
jgi:hypothetical protein